MEGKKLWLSLLLSLFCGSGYFSVVFFVDIFYDKDIGNTGKYRCGRPCCRVTEACKGIAHQMDGDDGYHKSGEEFRHAAHHGQEAVSASLHGISENKDDA